jgi:DUF2075 family protein
MKLYAGPASEFVHDTVRNQIADKLSAAFFGHFRYKPATSEMNSWRNSLRAMSDVVTHGSLLDTGVMLEYQLPLSSRRLDCMLTGTDGGGGARAVIVELKQWESCREADGEHVLTWVGGGEREVLHPSAQVGGYRMYLQDMHTAFYAGDEPVGIAACSYLHNYPFDAGDVLFSPKYGDLVASDPVFTKDDFDRLAGYIGAQVGSGDGMAVLDRIEHSELRPSKKLMDHVAGMIEGHAEYVLLDEQLVVFDKVLACARNAAADSRKQILIVRGGPGTGKSVIAINLMSRLLRDARSVQYATGSKAFTETLRKEIGRRGSGQFRYFNSYAGAPPDGLDVLICDEAHRIRKTSSNMYTPKAKRDGRPQIDELQSAARVGVYFIDDDQVVRPDEIGSSDLLRESARRNGAVVHEYELAAQFRCSGSDAFVNWINNTLAIRPTANILWERDERFDFRIMDSPSAVESAIRQKVGEGHTARMVAGYCWHWSKTPLPDGSLAADVQIGDYGRPWNARHEATHLAAGIPKAHLWAREPGGIDQIGCIYTAQGFEFDYVGVIFGQDLTYDPDANTWLGHRTLSHDSPVKRSGDRFVDLVKNTYRVLLTRGLRGCYVTFLDKDTERFFKSRMA